ncbi:MULTISPECIES: hypothetical protein [unclassified Pseudofrankia]|uniref:hypothetical protein n=1 Tax=unclassified Pseudofrankia TaxID=2994372 RepID=UPI0009F19BD6|nr:MULTISPECIES: hypothetical protein [unclassified Pseudofrankia]MDT3446308.1 hypothetical protein [Pseudofrankia sp. BMG5.37]
MGIMASLGFFAFGAVLAFAVRGDTPGIDLTAVGVIVMLVSVIGFATALYRERWRRHVFEESIEQGTHPPLPPDDGIVLVEPTAPLVAPARDIAPDIHR